MRAAIYARYSSDNQREASIEDQVRICKAYIAREQWSVEKVYSDAAISGATTLRPGYQKLLEAARDGALDLVVAESLDRLSRDQEDIAALYKQLTFSGVALVTLADGKVNELHVGLKGTMNALYLKDLADKTRRGLEGRVRQGRSGGGNAFGYDVVHETGPDGQITRGNRRINEAEAQTVVAIYESFARGKSPRAIAHGLNAEGVPGPGGRQWSDTTIRGHHTRRTGILRNELYVGRLVWNRQRYIKDPRTGKRLARPNPESEWIIHEVPALHIVDQELWEKVQSRLGAIREKPGVQKARSTRFWENRRPRHILTGLAKCGICESDFVSIGRDYLACSAARRKGTCDNKRSIRRSVLEELIVNALKRNLMAPELVKVFITEYHAELNRLNREQEQAITNKSKSLGMVARKIDGLYDAIADGLRTAGLKAKLEQLEYEKAALEAEIASSKTPAPRLHPNLAELYRRKVAELHDALRDPSTRSEAIELLRGLINEVILYPTDSGFEIELVGEIAKMIALPGGSGSAKSNLNECSVKVVAGAGFVEDPTISRAV